MGKFKIADIILSAVSALVAAVKAIIKLIGCITRLKKESAGSTA